MEVGAHEAAQSWDCRVEDCEFPAFQNQGRFAFLCDHHRREVVDHARQARRNGAGPAAPVKPAPSFEFRAAGLVQLGKQLDDALAAYEPARQALEEAYQRWQAAVAALPATPALNGELEGRTETAVLPV